MSPGLYVNCGQVVTVLQVLEGNWRMVHVLYLSENGGPFTGWLTPKFWRRIDL